MGKIRGILFDKDGTLMDFEAIWLPVLDELVEGLAQQFQLQEAKEKLLAAVGFIRGPSTVRASLPQAQER